MSSFSWDIVCMDGLEHFPISTLLYFTLSKQVKGSLWKTTTFAFFLSLSPYLHIGLLTVK